MPKPTYWTPQQGRNNAVRVVGHPFEVWQDWQQTGTKWRCYSYKPSDPKPPSAKRGWIVPVITDVDGGANVALWHIGKMVFNDLTEYSNDPDYGDGKWEGLYQWEFIARKVQHSNFPVIKLRPYPNPSQSPVPLLTAQAQQDLENDFWTNSQQQPMIVPPIIEQAKEPEPQNNEKIQKILQRMGYK